MTSEIVPAADTNSRAVDSLVANEFVVHVNEELATGIFTISGLVSFKLEVKTTNTLKRVHEPFKITKMVQRDPYNPFNAWIRETFSADADIVRPKRTVTIIAVDNDVPTRRWVVNKAWISEVTYSDFDSASGDMVVETLTIRHEGIDESWPLLEG